MKKIVKFGAMTLLLFGLAGCSNQHGYHDRNGYWEGAPNHIYGDDNRSYATGKGNGRYHHRNNRHRQHGGGHNKHRNGPRFHGGGHQGTHYHKW